MRLTSIFRLKLRSLLSRMKVEEELDEELRYHLERQIEERHYGVAQAVILGKCPRKQVPVSPNNSMMEAAIQPQHSNCGQRRAAR